MFGSITGSKLSWEVLLILPGAMPVTVVTWLLDWGWRVYGGVTHVSRAWLQCEHFERARADAANVLED